MHNQGRIGITILPGRKDKKRSLQEDISAILEQKITHVLCLATYDELVLYGVPELKQAYETAGLVTHFFPIMDQRAASVELTEQLLNWLQQALQQNANILIHCVGGLGRSGMISAAYLKRIQNMSSDAAIAAVRDTRSIRAIETKEQLRFIQDF